MTPRHLAASIDDPGRRGETIRVMQLTAPAEFDFDPGLG